MDAYLAAFAIFGKPPDGDPGPGLHSLRESRLATALAQGGNVIGCSSGPESPGGPLMSGQKFRRGGAGRILVGETGLKVQLLSQSMGDIAAMAEMSKTKEDSANAVHVPLVPID